MDLQLILALNVMVVSALALAVGLMQGSWRDTGLWLGINGLIVAVGAAMLQLAPDIAGTVVTLLFVPLVLTPAVLSRMVQSRVNQHRLKDALWFARLASWLHPSRQAHLNVAMLQAQSAGTLPDQIAAMRRVQDSAAPADRLVIEATILRVQGEWEKLLDLFQSNPEFAHSMAGLAVRTYGENGQLDRMARLYDDAKSRLQAGDLLVTQLIVLAFCGRPAEVDGLLGGPLSTLDQDTKNYWLAIAARSAGAPQIAWAPALDRLAHEASVESVRRAASRQFAIQPQYARAARLDDLSCVIVDDCAARLHRDDNPHAFSGRYTPLTWVLLAAIASAYTLSEMSGGSENLRTLVELGALWPPYVTYRGEWWRLVTALFLHWGPLHALANGLMLIVLGRACERAFGTPRMAVIYGIGGVASTTFVWWLAYSGFSEPSVLVGASGAIMALFGALAGRSIAVWLRYRDVLDGRNLMVIAIIVALQVAVDLSVPQVSLAAHASGLVAGIVLGFLLSQGRRQRR